MHVGKRVGHLIRILKMKHLLWRNVCSPHPVLLVELALGAAVDWTSATLPEPILQLLQEKLPGLRMAMPIMGAAQMVAAVSQELQVLGDVTPRNSDVVSQDAKARTALIFFSCRDPYLAIATLGAGAKLVSELCRPLPSLTRHSRQFERCMKDVARVALDRPTRTLIEIAGKRGIPWLRLNPLSRDIQFGQGVKQYRMRGTIGGSESKLSLELAANRLLTFGLMSELGLPIGQFATVTGMVSALRAAEKIGYPVALKPVSHNKGRLLPVKAGNPQELKAAFLAARKSRMPILLQSFFSGDPYRLLVVAGKLIAARKIPILGQEERVGAAGAMANETIDVAGIIHPDNVRAAEKAARAVGLHVAEVSFISSDIARSWHAVGGAICDVSSVLELNPSLRADSDIDIGEPIIESVYPSGGSGRIPTAMITGTAGKTTTSLMLKSILTAAGHAVGAATTQGVTIGDEKVMKGDSAGCNGAALVLRDPTVTAAVLETARGGLLMSGMYLDHCDVAALLSVGREQIGMDGIDTLDEMAAHKRKVIDAASAAVVLNADDHRCLAIAREVRSRIRTILFSANSESPNIREHIEMGGEGILVRRIDGRDTIVIESKIKTIFIVAVTDMPAAMNGLIGPNVWNAMAACGLAAGLDVAASHIERGLRQYKISYEASPGRFHFPDGFPLKILFDRAKTPPALAAAMSVVDAIVVPGKRICATTVPANRPAWHLEECASCLAGHFDIYVCYERHDWHVWDSERTKPGELAGRMARALAAAGVDANAIKVVGSIKDAACAIAREARAGDFVGVFGSGTAVDEYREAFAAVAQVDSEISQRHLQNSIEPENCDLQEAELRSGEIRK